ncbi:MAG: HAD-IA family hydrolase [Alphaproteobacteria bacterium]|nr:HAD-IA family hydrolase [Alphaproteobacteria bacterium]
MLPQPKAVIFDWDDTMVTTWEKTYAAFNAALVAMGEAEWTHEKIHAFCGPSAQDLFTQLFGDRWQEAEKVFYDEFERQSAKGVTLLEGAADVAAALHSKGLYLVVISNKRGPFLRAEVEQSGIAHFFKKIVGAGDAEKDKPDPAPVHLALADSGIAPGPDVWFVGDSITDMACAHATGCTPVLLETTKGVRDRLSQTPPAAVYGSHSELKVFIDTLS